MGFFESFKVRFRGSLQSLKIFSVKLHLLRHNYRLCGSVDHSALPTEFRRSYKDAYQIDRQIQKRPPMKFCNNQKSMLVGFGLILGVILLVLAQSVAAETRVSIWGRDIIIADDDRIVLQMDATNYLLPRDADKVPAVPQEGPVFLLFGAAGQFTDMAESHISKHNFEYHWINDQEIVTGCLLKNEIIRKYTT